MDASLHEPTCQRILESFAHTFGFANHATESFEHFIYYLLPEIIQEHFPVDVHNPKHQILHRLFLDHISFKRPTVCESSGFLRELNTTEAILRKQTYYFEVYIDVTQKSYKSAAFADAREKSVEKKEKAGTEEKLVLYDQRIYKNILFFKVPCLVRSSACHHAQQLNSLQDDGLFIINGYEKVMIAQEKLRCNFPYVFLYKGKYSHRCEIRCSHLAKYRSTSTLHIHITGEKGMAIPEIDIVVPFLKKGSIPLIVVFRLLGFRKVEDMLDQILTDQCSEALKYRAESILAQDHTNTATFNLEDLYNWVGARTTTEKNVKKRIQTVKNIFHNEFFPHCGVDFSTPAATERTNADKAFWLGKCIRKLLRVYIGEIPLDDIDDYVNKRCCTVGLQFTLFIRQLLRGTMKRLRNDIFNLINDRQALNLVDLINHRSVTSHLRYACATGNWGSQRTSNNQSGVCQVSNDTNLTARLAHVRQVNTPLNRDGKLAHPRQLHRTHLGLYCAMETPEGKAVGLLHQLGLLTRVRTGVPPKYIIDHIRASMGVKPVQKGKMLVSVNGIIAGCVDDPKEFMAMYKRYRQDHSVPIDSSITLGPEEVSILTDAEDCFRPLVRTENIYKLHGIVKEYGSYLHLLWHELLKEGVIDYINKEEEMSLLVAENVQQLKCSRKYSHLELDQSMTLFGLSAGIIPFSHHNQSPRNIYQCIHHQEPVLLSNGTWRAIADVVVGDEVITFDARGKTMATKVTWTMRSLTDKPLVRVTTQSGREIIVTNDHPFFTSAGWKAAAKIAKEVAIYNATKRCMQFEDVVVSDVTNMEPLICDITIAAETHCFISGGGGGFGVHNSSMGKQALGVQSLTFAQHLPTKAHVLNYGQQPLVGTFVERLVGYDEEPAGCNVLAGINMHKGYNQEDAVVMNRASVDRGLFRSTAYRLFRDAENRHGMDEERFGPYKTTNLRNKRKGNPNLLNDDLGVVPPGTCIQREDLLYHKSIKCADGSRRDASYAFSIPEPNVVERVMLSTTRDDLQSLAVQTSSQRSPDIGDKFSSRHGQKGVCGLIVPTEDMPFTQDGVPLDLVINPHMLPSRMTLAHLLEMFLGKVACVEGKRADGTPFRLREEEVDEVLNMKPMKEALYDGATGQRMTRPVFVGVITYQRLKKGCLAHQLEQRLLPLKQIRSNRQFPTPKIHPHELWKRRSWSGRGASKSNFNHPNEISPLHGHVLLQHPCPRNVGVGSKGHVRHSLLGYGQPAGRLGDKGGERRKVRAIKIQPTQIWHTQTLQQRKPQQCQVRGLVQVRASQLNQTVFHSFNKGSNECTFPTRIIVHKIRRNPSDIEY